MKKKHHILFLFLIGSLITLQAQNEETGFLFEDYADATIYFKGGLASEEKVNYNLLNNTLYFIDKQDGEIKSVSGIENLISVRVGGRTFLVEKDGLTEVLPTKPVIYVQYKAKGRTKAATAAYGGTSETSSTKSYSELRDGGSHARLKDLEFEISNLYNYYWIEKEEKKKKFTNFKQFLKIYPNHKNILESYIKEQNIDFEDVDAIVNLCLYAEKL